MAGTISTTMEAQDGTTAPTIGGVDPAGVVAAMEVMVAGLLGATVHATLEAAVAGKDLAMEVALLDMAVVAGDDCICGPSSAQKIRFNKDMILIEDGLGLT